MRAFVLLLLAASVARARERPPTRPLPRAGLGAAALDGRLYVVGARAREEDAQDRLDVQDPATSAVAWLLPSRY